MLFHQESTFIKNTSLFCVLCRLFCCVVCCVKLVACVAQKPIIVDVVSARHGNTARVGARLRDENGRPMDPPKGHDFYQLRLSPQAACELTPLCLWVDQQYTLFFSDKKEGDKKYTLAPHETIDLNAETGDLLIPYQAPPMPYAGKGLLKCRVNGKIQYIQIAGWKEIFPP